ncbi:putative GTPase [Anaerolinea thermolimosa]|uniref:GTP-binding protein n=1 Tax=Anaerolinea thermolimosa TaxID=229919 RepID=UPI0007807C23|nr:GTP-binding protein [Anaerolinea thermolimosa]GAP05936.1 putative GTPase [Anaerolinea thermolimosa]
MKLHLVGGFLGSGKTTAIIQACKRLLRTGRRVGVVTNDQGKFLVDTAFFRLEDVPAVEVAGGCFCCHYVDLEQKLGELMGSIRPDVIFAEAVGSCADLVATVLKPLAQFRASELAPTSLSVFTDARLLLHFLRGDAMPFSDEVVYIFEKQIEEAGLVVINKMDLLTPQAMVEVQGLFGRAYPEKNAIMQNSLAEDGVQAWLDWLDLQAEPRMGATLDIDYLRYGEGEARLAWYDAQVHLVVSDGDASVGVKTLIATVLEELEACKARVGHLKWMIEGEAGGGKLSFLSLPDPTWEQSLPARIGRQARILMNARVEMSADELRALCRRAFERSGVAVQVEEESAFHPGQPRPTHRLI